MQVHFTIRTVGCCYIWLKKTVLSLSLSHGSDHERPVISDEEFDEDATVRLSDFNALKEMFHELKDKFESLKMEKTMETMTPKSGDANGQMTSLQCFNSKDMIKPDQYDMEPGTFQLWNELFVCNMMSTDRTWGLILTTFQRKDAALKKKTSLASSGQSRLIRETLGVHERQSKRSSYFEFDRAFIRDVQANLPEG